MEKKKIFISYCYENQDKVDHIKKELKVNRHFEPVIIADKRKANSALSKLVQDGIDESYRLLPILTPQSYKTQWINQEIGCATGKNVPIIPIVADTIMNELKGFVHIQNQFPYIYRVSSGLIVRDENRNFMSCFRMLLNDLEEELRKDDNEFTKKVNASFLNQPYGSTALRTIIGTKVRSGEKCPESGIWSNDKHPYTTIPLSKDVRMPEYEGKTILWKLIRYN